MEIGQVSHRQCDIWLSEKCDVRVVASGVVVMLGSNPDLSLRWDVQIHKAEVYRGNNRIGPMNVELIDSQIKTQIERALIQNI